MTSINNLFKGFKSLGLLIILFSVFSGCAKYRIEHVEAKKFMKNHSRNGTDIDHTVNSDLGPIKKYKVFIHDSVGNTYRGTKSVIIDTLFTARLSKSGNVKIKDTIYRDALQDARRPYRVYHIYLNDSVQVKTGEVVISPSQIKEVKQYKKAPLTKGDRGPLTRIILLQVVGGIVIGFIIMIGIASLILNEIQDYASSCFVATMVYKDANASEVILLRKYRDEKLRHHLLGKAFIKVYYKISPTFVYLTKDIGFINRGIKWVLDKYVNFLSRKYNWELAV